MICLPRGLNKIKLIKFKNTENVALQETLENCVLHRHKLACVPYNTILCLILTTQSCVQMTKGLVLISYSHKHVLNVHTNVCHICTNYKI